MILYSDSENEPGRDDRAVKIRDVMNKLRREGRKSDRDNAVDRLDAVLKWKAKREEEKKKEQDKAKKT